MQECLLSTAMDGRRAEIARLLEAGDRVMQGAITEEQISAGHKRTFNY